MWLLIVIGLDKSKWYMQGLHLRTNIKKCTCFDEIGLVMCSKHSNHPILTMIGRAYVIVQSGVRISTFNS